MLESAVQLFGALWGKSQGWGEIRMLHAEHKPKAYFFPVPTAPKFQYLALDWLKTVNQQGYDAFFGVNPRNDKRGKNANVPYYVAAIADLDKPDASWPAVNKLADAGAPPSVCVRTTRGVHLYWLLAEPEPAVPATKNIIQRLQIALGSDAVHDPARVLRIPGTLYWKNRPTIAHTYTAWFNPDKRYTTTQLSAHVSALWPDVQASTLEDTDTPLLSMPGSTRPIRDDLWERFIRPWPKGSRSEHCLAFIQTALLYGWSDEMVSSTLATLPIGGHYKDRGSSSLEFDIHKARVHLANHVGDICHVQIHRVSLIENAPGTCDGNNFKIRVTFWVKSPNGMHAFDEWVIVPRTPNIRLLARWNAFTEATRYDGPPFDSVALTSLVGRELRVEVKNNGTRPRAVQFLPL